MAWNQIKERVLSAVVTAVIIALLAATWQLLTDGGLISALGGVTRSDLESNQSVPRGAVIAFDRSTGCPEDWSDFADGQSRVLVGAVLVNSDVPLGDDEAGNPLSGYRFRETGGKEQHVLGIEELPTHRHRVAGGFSARDSDNTRGGGELTNGGLALGDHYSAEVGGGEPHPNMPPYFAVYFCKK